MKTWPTYEAALRYYTSEGFIVGAAQCLNCELQWLTAIDPEADQNKLDCDRCGQANSRFIPDNSLDKHG